MKGKVEGYIGVVTAWILSKMLIDENVAGVANRENIREPNVWFGFNNQTKPNVTTEKKGNWFYSNIIK